MISDCADLIVYEDSFLLVLDKPPGMLIHPTVNESGHTLYDLVRNYYANRQMDATAHPVSRLDRFTSGLVIFAKEGIIHARLSQGLFEKEYLAITDRKPTADFGLIDAPIARKENSIIERCVNLDNGKPARTEYKVLKSGKHTLLALRLHSGRTHQIRVHLAYIGCPLHGDGLYGIPAPAGRHALHCWKLRFRHPVGDTILEITRNMPRDMWEILNT